jgi:hypothetical protein
MRKEERRGKCWASGRVWARERRRGKRARERRRERAFGLVTGLLLSFLSFSSFLSLFYTQTIQIKLFEFK